MFYEKYVLLIDSTHVLRNIARVKTIKHKYNSEIRKVHEQYFEALDSIIEACKAKEK